MPAPPDDPEQNRLAGRLSRYARVGILEIVRQDYVRTARAKGLSERTVVLKHALRNALLPMVTGALSTQSLVSVPLIPRAVAFHATSPLKISL